VYRMLLLLSPQFLHKVTITHLKAGEQHLYRVGCEEGGWSEWAMLRAPRAPEQFTGQQPVRPPAWMVLALERSFGMGVWRRFLLSRACWGFRSTPSMCACASENSFYTYENSEHNGARFPCRIVIKVGSEASPHMGPLPAT
jgi:hypothetical protein